MGARVDQIVERGCREVAPDYSYQCGVNDMHMQRGAERADAAFQYRNDDLKKLQAKMDVIAEIIKDIEQNNLSKYSEWE